MFLFYKRNFPGASTKNWIPYREKRRKRDRRVEEKTFYINEPTVYVFVERLQLSFEFYVLTMSYLLWRRQEWWGIPLFNWVQLTTVELNKDFIQIDITEKGLNGIDLMLPDMIVSVNFRYKSKK